MSQIIVPLLAGILGFTVAKSIKDKKEINQIGGKWDFLSKKQFFTVEKILDNLTESEIRYDILNLYKNGELDEIKQKYLNKYNQNFYYVSPTHDYALKGKYMISEIGQSFGGGNKEITLKPFSSLDLVDKNSKLLVTSNITFCISSELKDVYDYISDMITLDVIKTIDLSHLGINMDKSVYIHEVRSTQLQKGYFTIFICALAQFLKSTFGMETIILEPDALTNSVSTDTLENVIYPKYGFKQALGKPKTMFGKTYSEPLRKMYASIDDILELQRCKQIPDLI